MVALVYRGKYKATVILIIVDCTILHACFFQLLFGVDTLSLPNVTHLEGFNVDIVHWQHHGTVPTP